MGRAPCCDKANVKKGPWAPEEDAKLKAYIEKYGTGGNWIALPQKVGLKRCGKSCRLRWLNYLRPNIKHGGFTEEEDNIICSLYISIGSRWSIIAAQLPGRTDNDIKNYWNTRLKKKLLGRRKQNRLSISGQEPKEVNGDDNSYNLQNMSSSALERLQLHMHLQTLQNPLSFYNNPALWPKINPIQHKMIQTLHSLNENQNINLMHQISASPQPEVPLALDHQEYSPLSNLKKIDEVENCVNVFSSLKADQSNVLESGFTQAELDDLINNKSCNFLPNENQIGEFDCFKEMDGSKVNLGWWSNEFDANSASSSSWDSENMLHRSEGMYQDYGLGYSIQ
ncbi:hypothetical protein BUALT_Bualt12G0063200 [Buddleja alternifolia]|uniref:Uncharacterized protein n=1 Tax=Buddleja alternifolia TaxID=168488 RepID=A0AAV6WX56_9LAMI|nr:hypothetical protein BUALT_Bualt12G0063200 [Buddleja alternifolia]